MKYEVTGLSDLGLVRKNNEDFFLIDKDLNLFLVADGMGGYQKGEVASQLTCESMSFYLKNLFDTEKTDFNEENFKNAVLEANLKIREKISESNDLEKMGTTLVGILVKPDRLIIANVGDSRAYRFRNNKIEQISIDHSLVQESKAAGLKRELPSQFKNIVTRALGMKDSVSPDIYTIPYLKNDKYLLCSDGLHGLVSDNKMKDILSGSGNLNEKAKALIEAAKKAGGKDNITCVIIEMFENSIYTNQNNLDTQTIDIPFSEKKNIPFKNIQPKDKLFLLIIFCIIMTVVLILFFSLNLI